MVLEEVDLLALAQETAGLISILAEEKNQELRVNGEHSVIVLADRSLLSQAVLNLIDNAIKFSPGGVPIEVSVNRDEHCHPCLNVADHGPGIPLSERSHIFERFYRLQRSRDGVPGGVGLGLAIARWAVEANDGVISVGDTPGGGATFRIAFPTNQQSP